MSHRRRARQRPASIGVRSEHRPARPPGTLSTVPGAFPSTLDLIGYSAETYQEQRDATLQDLDRFRENFPLTWIDVRGLANTELIAALGKTLGLHPLALEDAVQPDHRPKVEQYQRTGFIILRRAPQAKGDLRLPQLSMFVGEGFVLTIDEGPDECLSALRDRIRLSKGRVRRRGADYLCYAIVDAVLDDLFPVLEEYSDSLEELEGRVALGSARSDAGSVQEVHETRHDLYLLRRLLRPTREAVHALVRGEIDLITDETKVYFRDCLDHATELLDTLDACREFGANLMELHLSQVNARLAEIMKVLTLFATIFMPLSFIAGIYGMNFNPSASPWSMPETQSPWGYPAVLLAMGSIAASLLYFFFRQGWLGRGRLRKGL